MWAVATNKTKQTDGRIGKKSEHIHASVLSSLGLLSLSPFALYFSKLKKQQKYRKVFHFHTSDYLNIHKYCDYFVSINIEIQKIRSQEFQSAVGNHYLICSFSIGPFRQ